MIYENNPFDDSDDDTLIICQYHRELHQRP